MQQMPLFLVTSICFLLFLSTMACSQQSANFDVRNEVSSSIETDISDSLPAWNLRYLYSNIVYRLRWKGWELLTANMRDELKRGNSVRLPFHSSNRRSYHEEIRLLSWSEGIWETEGGMGQGTKSREAVVSVRFEDSAGQKRWALIRLVQVIADDEEFEKEEERVQGWIYPECLSGVIALSSSQGDTSHTSMASLAPTPSEKTEQNAQGYIVLGTLAPPKDHVDTLSEVRYLYPCQIFDHSPTNADIVKFLWIEDRKFYCNERLNEVEDGHILDNLGYQITRSVVRETTWKAVIGEHYPTGLINISSEESGQH